MLPPSVEIVEVGPRDGFQGILPHIPTTRKIELVRGLASAGLRRIEIGSFVNPRAVPQLADTQQVLEACKETPDIVPQVLVANERYGRKAIEVGADFICYVLSVSEAHNRSNVRRSPAESAEEYLKLQAVLPPHVRVRLNVATAFDCPFDGRVDADATLGLLQRLITERPNVEVCLCDTTGRAVPDQVEQLFVKCCSSFPQVTRWAFHGHDTYGLGLANVYAAWRQHVRIFDAASGGLGGCPFAPGASGNVATEDVAWMFEQMATPTGIDLKRLIAVALQATALPGANKGGRVREAVLASGWVVSC